MPGDADDRRGGDDVVEFEVLIGGDIPQQVVAARLDTAYAALVDTLNTELAEWITAWAPATTQEQAKVLAAIGVNGILGARFATRLFHQPRRGSPTINTWPSGPKSWVPASKRSAPTSQ